MIDVLPATPSPTPSNCCEPGLGPRITAAELKQFNDDLTILNHPIRLQILDMLAQCEGQVCVCDLEAALPVKQPTVLHHLKLLREAGLIDCDRRGLWAHYTVRAEAVQQLRNPVAAYLATLR
jgi:ArsR family transcriptional regulator